MSASSLLVEEVKSVIECPICTDIMTIPKVLPCQHSFCLHCLQQNWSDKQDGELVSCPICRNEFLIPVGGLERLQDNFVIKKLISAQSAAKKKVGPRHVMCDAHPDKEIKIHCEDCKEGVCITCFIRNHNTHTCSDLGQHTGFKQRLGRIIHDDVSKRLVDIDLQIENVKKRIVTFTEKVDTVEGEMRSKADDVKRLVDEHFQLLIERLGSHRSRMIGGMETSLKRLDDMKRDLECLKEQCLKDIDNLSNFNSTPLVKAKEMNNLMMMDNDRYIEINFIPTDIETMMMEKKFAGNIIGDVSVSVYEKKDIQGMAISDKMLYVLYDKLSVINVYNIDNLEFERRILVQDKICQTQYYDIAATNNILFVSHYKNNLITRIQMPEETVTTLRYEVPSSSIEFTGATLSVTKNGNIIASDHLKLVEYTPAGRCVRTIIVLDKSLVLLRHGVQMKDDNFIVCFTTIESGRVCMIDNVGRLVKQVGGHLKSWFGDFHRPNYIALDKDGSVYVADKDNNRIVHLDSSLELVRQLSSESTGLTSPFKICMDQERRQLYVREFLDSVFRIVIIDIDK